MNSVRLIQKAVVKEKIVINPYKYYALKGESLYRIQQGDDVGFIHFDKNGKNLYSCGIICKTLNWCIKVDCFEEFFHEMVSISEQDKDFERQKEQILSLTNSPPVFIGGCGRSGTTLLLSILDAHPAIYGIQGETYALYPNPTRLPRLILALKDVNSRKWVEKTPKNIQVFRNIHDFFDGNVKLIHMVRDGRDVITSRHPNWKDSNEYWVPKERWIEDVEMGLFNKDISLLVKYEDLVTKPKETLNKICDYIEIDFDNVLLNYSDETAIKNDVAWESNAQNINTKRVGKWKSSEHDVIIEEFYKDEKAMALMKKLMYL